MNELIQRGFSEKQAKKIIHLNEEAHFYKNKKREILGRKLSPKSPVEFTDQESSESSCSFECISPVEQTESKSVEDKYFSQLQLNFEKLRLNQPINTSHYNNENKIKKKSSISREILISLQQSKYGLCMYDLITSETQAELFTFMEEGLSFDEAALMLFTRYKTEIKQRQQAIKHFDPSTTAADQNLSDIIWSQDDIEALRRKCERNFRRSTGAQRPATSSTSNNSSRRNSHSNSPQNQLSALAIRQFDLSADTQKQYPSPKHSPVALDKPLRLSRRNPFSNHSPSPTAAAQQY